MYDKEIALTGTINHVFGDILSALLSRGITVGALVDYPEKLMLDNDRLTVTHLDLGRHDALRSNFEGYADAVLTYNDDLRDEYTNDLTLKYFTDTVRAAREAGVKRIIVVGSPDSQAFFVNDLRRLDDIDWVYISTEGDYPRHVADEITDPRHHKEVYGA